MGYLNAEAEVYVLVVAGVGVEVVGGLAVELVALAEFSSYDEAEGYGTQAGGDPSEGLDEGRVLGFIVCLGWGRLDGSGSLCKLLTEDAALGEELHDGEMIAQVDDRWHIPGLGEGANV